MANGVVVNGQVNLLTTQQGLANAGALFTVCEPTFGTAVAYAQVTSYSATANGLFVIANNNAVDGGKNIYLNSITLRQTDTAPVGTFGVVEAVNETGIVAGTTAVVTRTPVNVNTGINGPGQSTGAVVQAFSAGAITIPAAVGTRRSIARTAFATGVNVVGDTIHILFGADGTYSQKNGGAAARATDTATLIANMPAVMVAPQTTTWINFYGPCGTNTPSYTYCLSYTEM